MQKALVLIGVYLAYTVLSTANAIPNTGVVNAYTRFLKRKNEGIGKRGNWQFIYTNEIYFLLSPLVSVVTSGIKDPFLYEVYEQCEKVISRGETNLSFVSTLPNWISQRIPNCPQSVISDVAEYEQKLFKVSSKLWNGKPLQL
jgi:hypothetical protein